jgi:hypothetical protein
LKGWGRGKTFFLFATSYPLYRYEILHITIQKEQGGEKHSFCTKRLGERKGVVFSFLFRQEREQGKSMTRTENS